MFTPGIHIHWQTHASMAAWPWEPPHRSHILYIQTHMVGGKERVCGVQTGRHTEKETGRDIQREREREKVGMGEKQRKRGLERGFYTIKHLAKYRINN